MKEKKTKPGSRIAIGSNVVVEIPLADGWPSMMMGKMLVRTEKKIVLTCAAWVCCTGRRTEFFAGRFDSNCEIEVYPATAEIELPAKGAVLYSWDHELPRVVR